MFPKKTKMAIMTEIIKTKLEMYLARGNLGDEISSSLAFFDLISLLSFEDGFEIEEKNQIFKSWKSLYNGSLQEALFETITTITGKTIEDVDEIQKIIDNKKILQEFFNKKFKDLYSAKPKVQSFKIFLDKLKEKYFPILHSYLNKQVTPEVTQARPQIQGGIGWFD